MPYNHNEENDNDIFIKFKSKQPLARMKDRYAMIGYSLGYGLNNGKKIASEEVLIEEVVYALSVHNTKKIIILIGDTLAKWNYQYLITHISDEELKTRLKDIPCDLNEEKLALYFAEKFADIAASLGKVVFDNLTCHFKKIDEFKKRLKNIPVEKIDALKKCLENTPNDFDEEKFADITDILGTKDFYKLKRYFTKILNIPIEKIEIKRWDERYTTENYNDKIEVDPTIKYLEETKKRFLSNKTYSFESANNRIKKAQPELGSFLDKVPSISSEHFIRAEYKYIKRLQNTDFTYPASCPKALESIFAQNNNCWREADITSRIMGKQHREMKKLKKMIALTKDDKPINVNSFFTSLTPSRLCRTQSSSALETISSQTLASRRAKLLPPLDTKNLINENDLKTNSYNNIFINAGKLSPKSAERLITFLNLYTQSPPSPEKEEALRKLEEANALLTVRA